MTATRTLLMPALLALSFAAPGCATDDPSATQPAPITALDLANGNRLEFYETSPGNLMLSELGQVGVGPTRTAGHSLVDIYSALAPGQPVPTALLDAQARATASHGVDPAPEAAAPIASIAAPTKQGYIDNQSCDDKWFNDTFCVGSPDWQVCMLNHWDGAFAQASSVDYVRHATCADIGNITLKVHMGDNTGGQWDVTEGTWRSFSWNDTSLFGNNQSTRGDILNASGNRFHYSVNANF